MRLIQLGMLDRTSARLGITIEQPVWNGSVGLFLGYHELETAEGRVAQMQWIVGGDHQNPAEQLNYRIRCAIVQIPRWQPYPITVKSLGHADVALSSDSKPVRLKIEFREGRFILVRGDKIHSLFRAISTTDRPHLLIMLVDGGCSIIVPQAGLGTQLVNFSKEKRHDL